MDGHALAPGDEAHDIVPGDRGAAAGKFDQAVVQSGHQHAVDGLALLQRRFFPPLGGLVDLVQHGLFFGGLLAAEQFVVHPVDGLGGGDAAVADGGVQVLHRGEGHALQKLGQQLLVGKDGGRQALGAQLRLKHIPAGGDVLVPAFLFEPLLDLGTGGAAFGHAEPVPAGARRVFRGADLDDIAVLQHMVQLHDAPVDGGAHHGVAHAGMDAVGEVDGGGAGGQIDHVALGGEHEHLVGEHIDLQVVEEVGGVGILLALQQAAHPGIALLLPVAHGGIAHLVFPVGGHAVFGGAVHLPGADLHLEGDALRADDRGMDGLIHIGLGRGNIVLETPRHRLEHIVDDAQHVVAVGNGIHDHAEGAQVENTVDIQLLGVHLAVDAVDVLDAAEDGGVDIVRGQTILDLLLHPGHEVLQHGHLGFQLGGDLLVARGVEVQQGQILQFPLGPLHAQPVGQRRIDLHGLQRLCPLFFLALISHGAHIVHPVGDFDEDDADILGHGEQHLAHILHLLVFLAGILHPGQLGHALHQIGHGGAEFFGDVVVAQGGILDNVVQQGRHDGILVQTHLLGDFRRRHAVGHIG